MTESPYPGLRPFQREEADIFFGREDHTDQLLEKLADTRFISVVGLSGCGKSSLVRAGMIAGLESGYMASAGTQWRIAMMRPGNHPLHNLAAALLDRSIVSSGEPGNSEAAIAQVFQRIASRGPLGFTAVLSEQELPPRTNVLLLVDQFEEIFRYSQWEQREEAEAFVALLLTSAEQHDIPIYIVTTMRSDFIGDCALFRGLPEMLNAGQFLVPRLTREQQRMAIVGPARVFGGELEPRLVKRLLDEMGTNPDQLPLLQHCLMRLWLRAVEQLSPETGEANPAEPSLLPCNTEIMITLEEYERIGGLAHALSNHADEAFEELDAEGQQIAEILFRRLSERGAGLRDTRRPTPLREIAHVAGVADERVMEVAEVFRHADRCFLTPPVTTPLDADTVLDISHESLIRQWGRLAQWVAEEAESAETYQRLEKTARRWQQGKAALWSTPDLELALNWNAAEQPSPAWAARYGSHFDLALHFLEASQQAREEQLRQEERAWEEQRLQEERERQKNIEMQRIRRRWRIAITGATVLALALLLAFLFGTLAWINAQKARQQTQIAEYEKVKAQQQTRIAQRKEAEARKQRQIAESSQTASQAQVERLQGNSLASLREAEKALEKAHPHIVFAEETLRETLAFIGGRCVSVWPHVSKKLAISPDNRWLATVDENRTALLWSLEGNENVFQAAPLPLGDDVSALAFRPDALSLVAAHGNGSILEWALDAEGISTQPHEVLTLDNSIEALKFSPDSRWLACHVKDVRIVLLDLVASPIKTYSKSHSGDVKMLFNTDSNWFITVWAGGDAYLWNLNARSPSSGVLSLREPGNSEITAAAFSPNSRYLLLGRRDSSFSMYELTETAPLEVASLQMPAYSNGIRALAITQDGQEALVFSEDRQMDMVWRLPLDSLPILPSPIPCYEFNGMGKKEAFIRHEQWLLMSTGNDLPDAHNDIVLLWNLAQADAALRPQILRGTAGTIGGLALTSDGCQIVTSSNSEQEGKTRLWDVAPVEMPEDRVEFPGEFVSIDQRWRVIVEYESDGGHIRLEPFDPNASLLAVLALHYDEEIVWNVVVSSNRRWLVTDSEQAIRVWDLAAENPAANSSRLLDNDGSLYTLAISADQQWLVTGSADDTVRLWNLNTEKPEAVVLRGYPGIIERAAISPDSQTLFSESDDGTVMAWPLPLDTVLEQADQILGTESEPNERGRNLYVFPPTSNELERR